MPRFIFTDGIHVRLDAVLSAQHQRDGSFTLVDGGQQIIGSTQDFLDEIISVTPVQGDWEVIRPDVADPKDPEVWAVPVLAWGLAAGGDLLPITPQDRNGVRGDFWLRRVGQRRIYGPEDSYEDEHEWRDMLLSRAS